MSHAVEKPVFCREDARGTFVEVRNAGPWETVICGRLKAGGTLGHHYHRLTSVFFFVVRGSARVSTIDVETRAQDRFAVAAGHGVLLRPGESHAIRFLEDSDYLLLKSHRYDPADPDTVAFPVPE